jgi:hypothetical protein
MSAEKTESKPKPEIVFELNCFEENGQAFFHVSDLSRPVENAFNWYGQNTSQWVYAGCIQVREDGSVSVHT